MINMGCTTKQSLQPTMVSTTMYIVYYDPLQSTRDHYSPLQSTTINPILPPLQSTHFILCRHSRLIHLVISNTSGKRSSDRAKYPETLPNIWKGRHQEKKKYFQIQVVRFKDHDLWIGGLLNLQIIWVAGNNEDYWGSAEFQCNLWIGSWLQISQASAIKVCFIVHDLRKRAELAEVGGWGGERSRLGHDLHWIFPAPN